MDLLRIRETAAKIRAKIGTLRLYGQLTEKEADSLLRDTEIILKETA